MTLSFITDRRLKLFKLLNEDSEYFHIGSMISIISKKELYGDNTKITWDLDILFGFLLYIQESVEIRNYPQQDKLHSTLDLM